MDCCKTVILSVSAEFFRAPVRGGGPPPPPGTGQTSAPPLVLPPRASPVPFKALPPLKGETYIKLGNNVKRHPILYSLIVKHPCL